MADDPDERPGPGSTGLGFSTRAIHDGEVPGAPDERPVSPPIWLTATYTYEGLEHYSDVINERRPGYVYGRYGNPTHTALHNVIENPFGAMLQSRLETVAFAVVALVGGAVREEVQRAFLLTRFERHLGGPVVGLVVTSLAFGAGHWVQGWDSSIAIGLLGAVWGFIYLRRRSVVAPMVSHAGFNSFEIVQFLIAGSV